MRAIKRKETRGTVKRRQRTLDEYLRAPKEESAEKLAPRITHLINSIMNAVKREPPVEFSGVNISKDVLNPRVLASLILNLKLTCVEDQGDKPKEECASFFKVKDIICFIECPNLNSLTREELSKKLREISEEEKANLLTYALNRGFLPKAVKTVLEASKNLEAGEPGTGLIFGNPQLKLVRKGKKKHYVELKWRHSECEGLIELSMHRRGARMFEEEGYVTYVLEYRINARRREDGKLVSINTICGDASKKVEDGVKRLARQIGEELVEEVGRHGVKAQIINISDSDASTYSIVGSLYIHREERENERPAILRYGPYTIPSTCGGVIKLYVAYPQSDEDERLYKAFKENYVDYTNKMFKSLGLEIDPIPVGLDLTKPLRHQLDEEELIGNKMGDCYAIVALLSERAKSLWGNGFEVIKSLSFKEGFYFKAQVVGVETLAKLADKKHQYLIAGGLTSSIIFRAGGCPWIVRPSMLSGLEDVDPLSRRVAVGVGLSKPSKKGFSLASVAMVNPYEGKVQVETLEVRASGRLGLEGVEKAKIVNTIKRMVESSGAREVAIYLGYKAKWSDLVDFHDLAVKKLPVERVVTARVPSKSYPILSANLKSYSGSHAMARINREGSLSILIFDNNKRSPLMVEMLSNQQFNDKDVMMEIATIDILKRLYYPSLRPGWPAPLRYAQRVARVAPYLKRLGGP